MPPQLSDLKLKLIEELGVFFEQNGLQPAAARISALLLVADKLELTFEEIYETLNISKSATSNALNFLLATNRAEYITKPGERRRYFRLKVQSLKDGVLKALTDLGSFNTLLKKVLTQHSDSNKEFKTTLKDATEYLDFMQAELPALFSKWENRRK